MEISDRVRTIIREVCAANQNGGLLGPVSWQHARKQGDIYDDVKNKTLYFIPAGYSQTMRVTAADSKSAFEINRQEIYKLLLADTNNTLGHMMNAEIILCPEPDNEYDSNAIQILLDNPQELDGFDSFANKSICIGYVPAKLCSHILPNFHRIESVVIDYFIENYKDKFIVARVAVKYI